MENDKLFELMSKMYEEMQNEFTNIREEMKGGFEKVDKEFKGVNGKLDRLEDKLDDLEVNNADRHITINRDVKQIKSTLSKVEIVTADNWSDIAKIKANKRHRAR